MIFEKYGLPIYPIVVYSHDAPKKKQPSVYRHDFPDGLVLLFKYRLVQLNRLSWRRFLKSDNPVASALMAKMKIAERDRPRVKVGAKLDPARQRLITGFVDSYLRLNEAEVVRFNALSETMLEPEQRKEVMEIVTSWELKGIEKGRVEGRVEGLRFALKFRFQQPGLDLMPRVRAITDPAVLDRLFEALEAAPDLDTFAALLPLQQA